MDPGKRADKVGIFILRGRTASVRFEIVVGGGSLGLGRSHKVVPAETLNANTAKTSAIGLSVSRFKLAEAYDFKRPELATLQQPGRARQLDVIFGLAQPGQSFTTPSSNTSASLQPTGTRTIRGPKNAFAD